MGILGDITSGITGGLFGGDVWNAAKGMLNGPKAPDTPDYLGAARATSAGNHTSQYTPYGSLVYSQGGNWDQAGYNAALATNPKARKEDYGYNQDAWTAKQTLSDNQAKILAQNEQLAKSLYKPEQNYANQIYNNSVNGFHGGDAAARQQTIDSQYGFQASRLDPQWAQRENAIDAKLANQGIAPGSEAWNNEMRELSNERNDAYSQARNTAIQLGNNEFQNSFQRDLTKYQLPVNMLNSLRGGSQVTNPNYINTPGGTDALGAAGLQGQSNMAQYNANVAANNSLMNGLFSLGGAAIMASDKRLKSNIKYVGKYKGHNFYNYDIFGRNEFGVMAQEVLETKPEAIHLHPAGFLMVDYGAL